MLERKPRFVRLLYHCKAAGSAAYGTIEGWLMELKDKRAMKQSLQDYRAGIFLACLAILLALAATLACNVERRKSDAELGLNPQQSAGRKIYDSNCDRCHEPYSTRGKKGPSLNGVFQHKYLSLSGLPANDERVTDIIRLGRNEMPGYGQTLSSQDIQDLLAYLHTL
jgi:mono/diheme cytochrome c family protein